MSEPTVWLLTTTDPMRMLDELYAGPGVELSDGRIVTLHSDYDALIRHMRATGHLRPGRLLRRRGLGQFPEL